MVVDNMRYLWSRIRIEIKLQGAEFITHNLFEFSIFNNFWEFKKSLQDGHLIEIAFCDPNHELIIGPTRRS